MSIEDVQQPDALPSEIRLPDDLSDEKETLLKQKIEEYDGVYFGSAVGFRGLIKRLTVGEKLTKAEYKSLILGTLMDEGSIDLVDYRKVLEDIDVGPYIDQKLWAEAATEVRRDIDQILG